MFSHFYMQILKFLWCMRVCLYTLGEWLSRATSRLRDVFIDYIMCFLKITKSAFNSSDSQKSECDVGLREVQRSLCYLWEIYVKCFEEMLVLIRYYIYIAYFLYRLVREAAINMSSKNLNHLWIIYYMNHLQYICSFNSLYYTRFVLL